MKLINLLVILFLSLSVYAEDQGGLAITTVPVDAEIYVNGDLKANSSPAYIILSEGKYQVEVRKTGKKTETLEIIVGKDTVVKKEVILFDVQPIQSKLSIPEMLNPRRDSFETPEEFQQRRENLLKQFNEAVQRHETAFQAGVATLDKDKYNIHTGTFPMKIEWAEWTQSYSLPEVSSITVNRDDAKAMWAEGAKKPVFLYMQLSETTPIKPDKQVIIARQREWTAAKYALFFLQSTTSEIRSLSFSGDSILLATGNALNSVLIWKLNTKKILEGNLARLSPASTIRFHPKQPILATASISVIRLENLLTEKTERTFSTDFAFAFDMAFSPEGDTIAVANSAKITLWDTKTGIEQHTFGRLKKPISKIAYATDGKTLAVVNTEGEMDMVNIATGNTVNGVVINKLTPEQQLKFAVDYRPSLWDNFVADQHHVATIAADKQIVILTDNVTHETTPLIGQKSDISILALRPNGLWLAAGHQDGSVNLWKLM